jgi:tetratricopeptide (TPR) repeat protein
MNLENIELYCNFDFEPDIKKKYENIILDIFNNMCPGNYYSNNMDDDMMIIIALYDISKKDYETAIDMLLEAINRNSKASLRASCTLGILYNILNNKEQSIEYFKFGAEKGHILSATNLAFEYLCQGEFDLFIKYNKIGLYCNDENALINEGIYLWNVVKNYNKATYIFNKMIDTNYRACYEYAKLVGNIKQKIELLIKAIKLKPKKSYIDMLKKITNDFERYELYKKHDIKTHTFKNYDNFEFNIKFNISNFSRCPACIKYKPNSDKIELFTLKCNHSFCSNCIKKYCQKNCCLCYV